MSILLTLTAYIVTTVETIGDVTATHEVSELKTDDKEYTVRLALFYLYPFFLTVRTNDLTSLDFQLH